MLCAKENESTNRYRKLTVVGARRRFQAKPERANTEQIPTRPGHDVVHCTCRCSLCVACGTEFPFQALLITSFLLRRILLITSFTTHETSRMSMIRRSTRYKTIQRVAPQETRGWPSRVVDGTAARAPRSPTTLPCAPLIHCSCEVATCDLLDYSTGYPTIVDC